jgi:thioredoxin reductase (NADPH)
MGAGGQVLIIDKIENSPGDLEPRTGYEFAEAMRKQAEKFGANFISDTVTKIETADRRGFITRLASGKTLESPAVIFAAGAKRRALGVKGEAEFAGRGVSYCATCDGPAFKGKPMLVVGGGDSACDEAAYLARLTDRVILIHRRDRFRAQKALAERVLHNPHIETRFNTQLREIKGERLVDSVVLEETLPGTKGRLYEESVKGVFIFIGTIPQTAAISSLGPKLDEAGYVDTDQRMASSIPGLFAAGDVRSSPFRQVITACADGATAAHEAAAYIDELRGQAYR